MRNPKFRFILPFAGFFLFVSSAFLILSHIQRGPQSIYVDLSAAPAATPERGETPYLRFAVAPVWSPERTARLYDELARHVTSPLHRPVRIVRRHTPAEINELLRDGTAQAGIVHAGAYLAARREGIPLDAVAVPLREGQPYCSSILLTRADGPHETIDDLRGRSFGFTDPLSLSGYYYPVSMLLEAQKDPDTYFSRTVYTLNHDASMRAVRDGLVDAVAVDALVYEYEAKRSPLWDETLRVIHRSAPLAISPVVVPSQGDPTVRRAIERSLLTMHESRRGREILRGLDIERFVAPPEGLFDQEAQVVDRVEAYLGARQ